MREGFTDSSAVEAAFYAAFQALDSGAMRELWAPGPEAYCVHPGGQLLRGPDAIMQSWAEIFLSAEPPTILYRMLGRQRTPEMAVHLVEERISPSGPKSVPSRLVCTNVYALLDSGWRMIGHHASLPLVRMGGGASAKPLH